MTRVSVWLSAQSSVKKIHHSLARAGARRGEKRLLEINSATYKPTNTDTIWVGASAAVFGKTKGRELSAKVFSARNISFLSTNTFSIEDLIKRVWEFVWGVPGSGAIIKSPVTEPESQTACCWIHSSHFSPLIFLSFLFFLKIVICRHILIYEVCRCEASVFLLKVLGSGEIELPKWNQKLCFFSLFFFFFFLSLAGFWGFVPSFW